MQRLLAWIAAARFRTVAVIVLASQLPPLNVASSGLVAMTTLRNGWRDGLFVTVVPATIVTAVGLLAGGSLAVLPITLVLWGSVLLLAALLGYTRSLQLCVQLIVVLSCALVALILTLVPVESWRTLLENQWPIAEGNAEDLAVMREWRESLLPAMAGISSMAFGMHLVIALFAGRWGQAVLDKPGAFGAEFRSLRMGKVLGVIAGAVFVAGWLTGVGLLTNLTLVLQLAFLLQGLAVVHALVAAGALGSIWLVSMYVLMLLVAPVIVILGFVDNWIDLRRLVSTRPRE